MSETISQILSEYSGFEKAFWATYSVNFTTLDFLLKKDFKQIMSPHYLHLICDGNQLDETIAKTYDERKDLSRITKLQEYCTISPQFTEGAFHPKILVFTSADKLLIIVSSANATPSGILSNQDLIGLFYYDAEHTDHQNEVCSLFQYMRSFEGWGPEAIEDFNIVAEDFSFLNEPLPTENILTIPNENDLFTQIIDGLPDSNDIKTINVFSPFFDDTYRAIATIEDQFKIPVNIFSPQKEFHTARKEKLSNNVKFYHSDTQLNKSFHAKFYEFKYENESIVYWGSANCSFSGLLSPNRNYEFLIKTHMTTEEVQSIWGSLDSKKESTVEYGYKIEENNDPKSNPDIYIKQVSTENQSFIIQLDKHITIETIVGVLNDGSPVELSIQSIEDKTVNAACEEKGLIILYIAKNQQRISNLIYINNPLAIKARVSGKQSSPYFDPKDVNNAKAVTLAFGYFNLKLPEQKSSSTNSTLSRKGFWRLPQFKSRSSLSRIINLESFISRRIIKFKEKNDIENNEGAIKTKTQLRSKSKNIINKISKETGKLLENITTIIKTKKTDKIEASRWLQGIDILNYFILNYLDENQDLHNNIDSIQTALLNTSRVSAWIVFNLTNIEENHQSRVEIIKTVQDILLGFSIYNLLLFRRFHNSLHHTKEEIEFLKLIKRVIYLRHIINDKFPQYQSFSEHSQLSYEDVLQKLPHAKVWNQTIGILNRNKVFGINGLDEVQVVKNQTGILFLTSEDSAYMNLETVLGEEKTFSITAPLVKESIIF